MKQDQITQAFVSKTKLLLQQLEDGVKGGRYRDTIEAYGEYHKGMREACLGIYQEAMLAQAKAGIKVKEMCAEACRDVGETPAQRVVAQVCEGRIRNLPLTWDMV